MSLLDEARDRVITHARNVISESYGEEYYVEDVLCELVATRLMDALHEAIDDLDNIEAAELDDSRLAEDTRFPER